MRWKGGIDAKKPLSLGCGATRPLKKLRSERLAGGCTCIYKAANLHVLWLLQRQLML